MGRNLKIGAEFFKHDRDMRNDPKIRALRSKFGYGSHGIYCMILETLCDTDNFSLKWDDLNIKLTAGDFCIDPDILMSIVDFCIEVELFEINSNILTCNTLNERLGPMLDKRAANRERMKDTRGSTADPSSPPKKPKTDREFEITKENRDLCLWFLSTFTENARSKFTDSQKRKWAENIYDCHRLDGFSYDEITEIVQWARNDKTFWRAQFNSLTKIRKKGKDQDVTNIFRWQEQMNQEKSNKNNIGNGGKKRNQPRAASSFTKFRK